VGHVHVVDRLVGDRPGGIGNVARYQADRVQSVAGRLDEDHALEAGLPVDQRVRDRPEAAVDRAHERNHVQDAADVAEQVAPDAQLGEVPEDGNRGHDQDVAIACATSSSLPA